MKHKFSQRVANHLACYRVPLTVAHIRDEMVGLDPDDAEAILTAYAKELFVAGAAYAAQHREDEYGGLEAMKWLHDHGLPPVKLEVE